MLTALLSIAGVVVGVMGAAYARRALAPNDVALDRQRFLDARRAANADRARLSDAAGALLQAGSQLRSVGGSSLLSKPSWLFDQPYPLPAVRLAPLTPSFAPTLTPRLRHLLTRHLPRRESGRYASYAEAIEALDPPRGTYENRISYRLLDFTTTPAPGEPHMRFSLCRYFDMVGVGETLAMEFALSAAGRAAVHQDVPRPVIWPWRHAYPIRRELGDPTNLRAHPVLPAINTLTIRLTPQGRATFFLHMRGAEDVPVAAGQTHVIPCGGFQPSAQHQIAIAEDFDLWRSISREYAEELLGLPEAYGDKGDQLDYETTSPYADLMRGVRDGTIRPWMFGAALDPLSYYVEFLTATVFDAATFDAIFPAIVERNLEGKVIRGKDGRGLDFTEPNVMRTLSDDHLAPAGAACLTLAWHHRDLLLAHS